MRRTDIIRTYNDITVKNCSNLPIRYLLYKKKKKNIINLRE